MPRVFSCFLPEMAVEPLGSANIRALTTSPFTNRLRRRGLLTYGCAPPEGPAWHDREPQIGPSRWNRRVQWLIERGGVDRMRYVLQGSATYRRDEIRPEAGEDYHYASRLVDAS